MRAFRINRHGAWSKKKIRTHRTKLMPKSRKSKPPLPRPRPIPSLNYLRSNSCHLLPVTSPQSSASPLLVPRLLNQSPLPTHTHPTQRPITDTPCPGATARPGAWQTARGKPKAKPSAAGPSVPTYAPPHSPTRGRPEGRSRPAVRVAPGRSRGSQSVGRYPRDGGIFSNI